MHVEVYLCLYELTVDISLPRAKGSLFSPLSVCLSVCLSVHQITQVITYLDEIFWRGEMAH